MTPRAPRVRFAPSPTGQLHVGNARTALFNWLFARRHGGVFVLRIEDTDTGRQQGGAEEAIYDDLRWLGLDWDEGPVPFRSCAAVPSPAQRHGGASRQTARGALSSVPGSHGPYRQSERAEFYRRAVEALRAKGVVYRCFCTEQVLEEDRARALREGRTPGYDGRCAALDEGSAEARARAGELFALRYRVRGFGVVADIVRGEVDFRSRQAHDPVIVRGDGRPTYNFAVVVDDAAMEITHVLRGEDHLTNTALQLRLFEDLRLSPPAYAHLPLILGPDGSPLSKRHGASSVAEMRQRGYPAEALVNGLVLLGWTPPGDRVRVSRDEMVALFDLARVSPTAAIFDEAKLAWLSSQTIRTMERLERGRRCGEALRQAGLLSRLPAGTGEEGGAGTRNGDSARSGDEPAGEREGFDAVVLAWLADLGDLLATSIERFDQVSLLAGFVFDWSADRAAREGALADAEAARVLEAFAGGFEAVATTGPDDVSRAIERAKAETMLKGRALLHPLRVAATARESGPDLARSLPLIERAARLALTPPGTDLASRLRAVLARGPVANGS